MQCRFTSHSTTKIRALPPHRHGLPVAAEKPNYPSVLRSFARALTDADLYEQATPAGFVRKRRHFLT